MKTTLLSPLAAACLLCACSTTPSLVYRVALAPAESKSAIVTLDLQGSPHDSLVLRAFAPAEVMQISEIQARAQSGAALPIEIAPEAVTQGRTVYEVPRFVLPGPLPPSVSIRYRVTPAERQGNAHTGFTGMAYGHVAPDFVLLTGRSLFLLPEPAEAVRRVRIEITPPLGWEVITPWSRGGQDRSFGLHGRFAAEDVIGATLALGRFRQESFWLGGTRFRFAFVATVPTAELDRTARIIKETVRYIYGTFGRGLGPQYLAIIAPRGTNGDEILGEGWATGQGGTLTPVTVERLHRFALKLTDAYFLYPPYRTTIRDSDDYWLADGLSGLYAWKAVASAGFLDADDIKRRLLFSYLTSRRVAGVERNLDHLYSTALDPRIGREVLAPLAVIGLDETVRRATVDRTDLDRLLPGMLARRRIRSLRSCVPWLPEPLWDGFRSRYVTGRDSLTPEHLMALQPTQRLPEPPPGPVRRQLTIAITGDTYGYLENCGCRVNQSGGVARRATILGRIRLQSADVPLVDAGNAFIRPDKQKDLDYLSLREQRLYLRIMQSEGVGAAAIGVTELMYGPEHFHAMTQGLTIPYVAANVRVAGAPLAPAFRVIRASGLRLAVIGVLEPPRGQSADPLFEERNVGLEVESPAAALKRLVPAARKDADLIVVIGRLTPHTIRQLAKDCPGIDAVISSEQQESVLASTAPSDSLVVDHDEPGFLGRTLVLYTSLRNYGLMTARLDIDGGGRIASFTVTPYWLRSDVPDDGRVRAVLDAFYDRIGREEAAQSSVTPPFAGDPERMNGRYVGARRCFACHESEFRQWVTTKHAGAYKTLLDAHRHFQPRCVSCHVVGYGARNGYRLGQPEEPLANVQCEECHGPGGDHSELPRKDNIRRQVPADVCLQCHTPTHSDNFVYSEKVPMVRHDQVEARTNHSGASSAATGRDGG